MEVKALENAEVAKPSTTEVVAEHRERGEIEAQVIMARRFPRNEMVAIERINRSCVRPSFANLAQYEFPRGGTQIKGPSVEFARELAAAWGNMRSGIRVVDEDDERLHIKGFAFDLETNTYSEGEDKFAKKIQRRNKKTGETSWVTPDERDLRELLNRRGAILERNAILKILPKWLVEESLEQVEQTKQKASSGELSQDRTGTITRLVKAFSGLGVNVQMIENYLGHGLDVLQPGELASLRAAHQSISDGNSTVDETFVTGPEHRSVADTVNQEIKGTSSTSKAGGTGDFMEGSGGELDTEGLPTNLKKRRSALTEKVKAFRDHRDFDLYCGAEGVDPSAVGRASVSSLYLVWRKLLEAEMGAE